MFGVDLTVADIALSRKRFVLQDLTGRFAVGNAASLPFPAACFDYVCVMRVVYHTPDARVTIEEVLWCSNRTDLRS